MPGSVKFSFAKFDLISFSMQMAQLKLNNIQCTRHIKGLWFYYYMKRHEAITMVPSQDMCLSTLGFSFQASYIETHFLNYWCGVWCMSNSAVLFVKVIWRQATRMEMDESWRTESRKTTALFPTMQGSLHSHCTPSTRSDSPPVERVRMKYH